MSETVVELKQPEKKPKPIRAKIEQVQPTAIVDVWRLVEKSLRDGGQIYPDTTEDSPELIRSHLFHYLQQPNFLGLMARVGKRPVAVILGNITGRPYGRPSHFGFIWCLWVDPAFRKQGVGKVLCNEYFAQLKRANVFHWEAVVSDEIAKQITEYSKGKGTKLLSVIGGRV